VNDVITIDGIRYQRIDRIANRVSCWGMYDAHLFHRFEGLTPEEIAEKWKTHKDPKYGKTMLCPVIVLEGDKEIRRVGPAVHHEDGLPKWLSACNADPDIPRLLAAGASSRR